MTITELAEMLLHVRKTYPRARIVFEGVTAGGEKVRIAPTGELRVERGKLGSHIVVMTGENLEI